MEPLLAFDRGTSRAYDADGHLHVAASTITEACVSPYLGREIVGGAALGLAPDRIYHLLRDPAELAKGAASFAGKPLLSTHKPLTAEDHAHALTVGTVANPHYDSASGRIVADLSVWDAGAIRNIQSGQKKFLSCAYRYTPDMRPGTYRGQRYDGVMRDIQANHVALVDKPRVPQAYVGDSARALPKDKARISIIMDEAPSPDPIEVVTSVLKKAGYDGTCISQVRNYLARRIRQAATEAKDNPTQPAPSMNNSDRPTPTSLPGDPDPDRNKWAADSDSPADRLARMFPHYRRLA